MIYYSDIEKYCYIILNSFNNLKYNVKILELNKKLETFTNIETKIKLDNIFCFKNGNLNINNKYNIIYFNNKLINIQHDYIIKIYNYIINNTNKTHNYIIYFELYLLFKNDKYHYIIHKFSYIQIVNIQYLDVSVLNNKIDSNIPEIYLITKQIYIENKKIHLGLYLNYIQYKYKNIIYYNNNIHQIGGSVYIDKPINSLNINIFDKKYSRLQDIEILKKYYPFFDKKDLLNIESQLITLLFNQQTSYANLKLLTRYIEYKQQNKIKFHDKILTLQNIKVAIENAD